MDLGKGLSQGSLQGQLILLPLQISHVQVLVKELGPFCMGQAFRIYLIIKAENGVDFSNLLAIPRLIIQRKSGTP